MENFGNSIWFLNHSAVGAHVLTQDLKQMLINDAFV